MLDDRMGYYSNDGFAFYFSAAVGVFSSWHLLFDGGGKVMDFINSTYYSSSSVAILLTLLWVAAVPVTGLLAGGATYRTLEIIQSFIHAKGDLHDKVTKEGGLKAFIEGKCRRVFATP